MIPGEFDAAPCQSAIVDVYSCYTRETYQVTQGNHTAIVSVLSPGHGVAMVYRHVTPLPGEPAPVSAPGTCASVRTLPIVTAGCDPSTSAVQQQPTLLPRRASPLVEDATWGRIKDLYGAD